MTLRRPWKVPKGLNEAVLVALVSRLNLLRLRYGTRPSGSSRIKRATWQRSARPVAGEEAGRPENGWVRSTRPLKVVH